MRVTSAHKVVLGSVSDTTEVEKLIGDGAVDADAVVAVIALKPRAALAAGEILDEALLGPIAIGG